MKAEHGCFEVYYNEPGELDGLYRCDVRSGDVYYLEGHYFVVGNDYVGTSTESLELALQQFCHIRNVLSKIAGDCC